MQDKIFIKIWRSPKSVSLIFLNLKYGQKWYKRKKQSQRCINLYTNGCNDVVLYIPHAMALIISGRPRIPIVSAERIVVHQIKFYHLKDIRRKFAVGHNGFYPTPFCFSMFPVEIRKRKHKKLKNAENCTEFKSLNNKNKQQFSFPQKKHVRGIVHAKNLTKKIDPLSTVVSLSWSWSWSGRTFSLMRDQSILIRGGVGFDGFLGDHMPFRGDWRGGAG